METEGKIEQAMDEFLTKNNASSVGDDRDYFELNYDDSSMNGQPLTPVTKYVKTSSNILVELRKQGTPMKNTWTPKAGTPATSRKTGGHDENHSPCSPNVASTSPPILQKLRDHRGEGPKRPRSAGVATPKPSSKSLITPDNAVIKDYKDLIQNVRNDMKLPNNTTENGDISGQETLSATRIEYGSPGTFSDRAMAFTRDYRDSSKDQSGQINKNSGKSFTTNVGKNNTCPKCRLVIFKAEELVAAGAAWHKNCFKCGDDESIWGCNRTLTLDSYVSYGGWAFCKACYTKNFKQGGTSLGAVLPTELINFKRRVSITQAPKLLLNIKRRTSVQVYEDALYGKRTYIDAGDAPVSEGTLYGKRTCTEVLPSNTHQESNDVNGDLEMFFDRQLLSSEAPMSACMNGLHTSVQASRRGSATLTSTGSTEYTAECGYSETVLTPMPRGAGAGSSMKLVVGTTMQELQTPSVAVNGIGGGDNENESLKTTPSPTTTTMQLDSPSDSPFHDSNGKLKSDFTIDQLSPKNGLFSVLGPSQSQSSSPFPTTTTLYSVHTPSMSGGPRGYKQHNNNNGDDNGNGDGLSPPTETFTPFSDNKKMSNIDHNRSNSPDISRGGFFPPISPVQVSENISLVSPYRPAGYPTEPDSACSQSSSTTHTFSAHSTPEIIPSYNSRDSFQGSNPRLSTRARSPSQQDTFPVDPVKGENNKKLFDTAHMIGVQRAEVLETGRWSIKIPTINRWRHPSQTGASVNVVSTLNNNNNNRGVTDNEMDILSGNEKNVLESQKKIEEYSSGTEGSSGAGYMQYFFEEEHLADRMSKSGSACASPQRSLPLPQPQKEKDKVLCVVESKKEVGVSKNEMKGDCKRVQLSSSSFNTSSSLSSSLPASLPTTTTTSDGDNQPSNYAGVILKPIPTLIPITTQAKDVIPPFRLTGDESESELEESPDNSETKINTMANRSIAACAALNLKYDQKILSSKPLPVTATVPVTATAPVTTTVTVPMIVKKIEESEKVEKKIEMNNNNNNDNKRLSIIKNGEFIKLFTQVNENEKEINQPERKVELKKTGIIGLWDVDQKDGFTDNAVKTIETVKTVKTVETEITIVREESRVRSTSSNFEARVVKKLDFNDNENDDYLDADNDNMSSNTSSGIQHFNDQHKEKEIVTVKEMKKVEEIEKIIEKTEKRKSGAINLWEAKKKAVKDEDDRKDKENKEEKEGDIDRENVKKDEKNKPRALYLWEQKSAAVKLNSTSTTINSNNNPILDNNSIIKLKNDNTDNNKEVVVAAKTEKNVGRLAGFFNREKSDNKLLSAHSWLSKKVPSFRNNEKEVVKEKEVEVLVSSNKKEVKLWDQKNLKNTIKINKSASNSSHKSANKNNSVKKSYSKNEKEEEGGEDGDGEESGSECLDLWPDDDMTEDGDRHHDNEEEEEEEGENEHENETDSVTVVMDKTWRVEASMTGESSVEGESITVLKMGDIHEDTEEDEEEEVVRKAEKEVENGNGETSFLNVSEESSDALVSVSLHSNGSLDGKGQGEEEKGGDEDKEEGKGINEGKGKGKGKEKKGGGVFSMIESVMTTPKKGKTAANKVEEEITIEDEVHSVTPKKKAGSTVTPVEEAVEITPKESLQSRAMKFLKPALTPVPSSVASRPAVTTVTTTSSSTSIPTSSSVATTTSIPTSPPPPYVPLSSVSVVSMLPLPLPLPTVAATANASAGTINLSPATEKPVMSFEPGSRLSRSITAECEAAAAAVDSVEYESEGRLKSPAGSGSSDYRDKRDINGDKRSSKVQLLDRNSASFLPPASSKRQSVSKLMGNMLKRIVYPTSTSSTTATSSAAISAADATRSVIPDGFGELPVVVTPNTKAKRRSSTGNMNLTFYQKKEESDSGAVSMDVDIGAGKLLIPDRYQMMTGQMGFPGEMCVPRSWKILGKEKESSEWTVLRIHIKDTKLSDKPCSAASWSLGGEGKEKGGTANRWSFRQKETMWRGTNAKGFRYYRLIQTGFNSGGLPDLKIGGLRLLGTLVENS